MKLEELAKKMGRRIKELRARRGLTQEEMEEFGIPYKYYQRIESPGSHPANLTLKTLLKIAAALEVEVSELFEFADVKRKKEKPKA